jgi:hypothetical protein
MVAAQAADPPPGQKRPNRGMSDTSAMASTAGQELAGARDACVALAALGARFPDPPRAA